MDEQSSAPLSMIIFDLIVSLCSVFPSLNPISIRDYDSIEVIILINKMIRKGRMAEYTSKPKAQKRRVYADEVDWF